MNHRHIIDNRKKSNVHAIRVIIATILLINACLYSGASDDRWTPMPPEIDRIQQLLDKALIADSIASPAASDLIARMESCYVRHPSEELKKNLVYWQTESNLSRGVPAAELLRTMDSAGTLDSLTNTYTWIRANFLRLKIFLFHEKNYPEVYNLSERMLSSIPSEDYPGEVAMLHAIRGLLFYMIDSPEEAYTSQRLAREEFTGTGRILDSLRNELNICNTMAQIGREQETIKVLQTLERNPVVRRNTKLHCNILMSLHYYTHHDSYALAAYREAQLTDNETMKMKTYQNLSKILYREGRTEESLDIQKKVYNFFRRRNDPDMLIPLQGIVEIYDEKGNRDSTLAYMRRLIAAQNTFRHAENMSLIAKMKAQSEISKLKFNVSLAESRTSLEQRKNTIVVTICLAVIIIVLISLIYYKRKVTLEKKLRQSEFEQLSIKLQNEKFKNENSKITIDSQERELTSKALLILNKNNMLNDLLARIHSFEEEGKIPDKQAKILADMIKRQLSSSSDWDEFTVHFEQMSPGFFKNLKERYPMLSDKDLKLCAYIKLGFTSKQIAQMMSVLPESINTTRYRMRGKMQLSPGESIEDILRNIETS